VVRISIDIPLFVFIIAGWSDFRVKKVKTATKHEDLFQKRRACINKWRRSRL